MPKLLCKTIEAFYIQGRGTVVTLEDPCDWRIPAKEVVKRREAIRILRPDQSSVKTFIKDFEFMRTFGGGEALLIQLPNDVRVDDVPKGSLVFLEREDAEPVLWDGRKAEFTKAEQVGAGQPATRSESDSEGGDKPQPEAEGRSR
jgi:hypothetical protein